jgi:hypothetical protein
MKFAEFWGFGGIASKLRTPCALRAGAVLAALLPPIPALAADPPSPHSGFYIGGNVGYGFGNAQATLGDPTGMATAEGTTQYGMLFGGVQAGYEHVFPSRLMLGIEADLSFPDWMDLSRTMSFRATANGSANEQLDYLGTLRGRLGYSMGSWTPFIRRGVTEWSIQRLIQSGQGAGAYRVDGIPRALSGTRRLPRHCERSKRRADGRSVGALIRGSWQTVSTTTPWC